MEPLLSKKLIATTSQYVGECFDIVKPILNHESKELQAYVRFVVAQLYMDILLTNESIWLLLSQDKIWDAEVLQRTNLEGSLKLIYILDGDKDHSNQAAFEFWETLANQQAVKRTERIESMLEDVCFDEKSVGTFEEMRLELSEKKRIREGNNKKKRRLLEEKWSFHGLIRYFSNKGDEETQYLKHLAYPYGMASHLIHKDGVGVQMVWERSQRNAIEQHDINLSQSARLLRELCALSSLRTIFLLKSSSQKNDKLDNLNVKYEELFLELEKIRNIFNADNFSD